MRHDSWSVILTTLHDFATTVGLPMATRDKQTGDWSGVGVMCSPLNEYGQIKLSFRDDAGASWPIGSLTKPVPLTMLPMIADTIVHVGVLRDQLGTSEPTSPVVAAIATMTAPNRGSKRTCPRCHRRIGGDFLPCQCPLAEMTDASPVEVLAKAVTILRNADVRIGNALGTARLEGYERSDLKSARADIGEAKALIESAATATIPPTPTVPDIDVFDLREERVA